MKGIVKGLNERIGFFAVELDNGEFSVCEITDSCSVELGNILSGNLENLAGETLKNLSRNEDIDVFIQATHCDMKRVLELLKGDLGWVS